jgi:hypothetical protein
MATIATWTPEDVPASGTSDTRFAIGSKPSGVSSRPDETVSNVYAALSEKRIAEAEHRRPETRTVALRLVTKSDGKWVLLDRGSVTGVVTAEPVRPGRFWKAPKPGALLDELMLGPKGGESYTNATDQRVFEALLEVCASLDCSPRAARAISDAVCRVVCLRAGLIVPPWDLPNPTGTVIATAPEGTSK